MSITYINKQGIIDDVEKRLQTEIDTHEADITNPHSVTAAQVSAVPLTSIVDNLTTDDATKVLSAKQGKELEDKKVDKNIAITSATKTKITYDTKGLVTAGEDLTADDIPALAISKITDFPTTMPPTTHQHTKSEITDFPTIPTIPDITVDNGNVESGKYISQVAVDETNKHKLNITKENLPTGFSGNYDDLIGAPTIPTVPTISTDIETDATSDIKTTSPKAVKTYVDNTISTAIGDIETLLGGI